MTRTTSYTPPAGILPFVAACSALRGLDPYFSINQLSVLADLVVHPGSSMGDLAERSRITKSNLSRIIGQLGEGAEGKAGLGLVEVVPHLHNRRIKLVFLTPAGRDLMTRIIRTVDKEQEAPRETTALYGVDIALQRDTQAA